MPSRSRGMAPRRCSGRAHTILTGAAGAGAAFIYVAAPIAEAPTLSEWGLILLTLLLAAGGWATLRRQPRLGR